MICIPTHRSGRPISVWAGILLLAGMTGCSQSTATVESIEPTIALRDFGLQELELPASGYVVLESTPSQGRFPTGLGVALMEPVTESDTAGSIWQIREVPAERAVYWNSLFSTEPAVREVLMLDELTIGGGKGTVAEIVRAAARAQAGLCLVYGPRATRLEEYGYLAVLLDTTDGRVIAVVQSQAGPEDFTPTPRDRIKTDMRTSDAEYIALRKLQAQVRRCTLELAAKDERGEATQTSPWQEAATRPAPVYLVPFDRAP